MFYGCSKYPNCTYTARKLPEKEAPKAEGAAE
jgi:ssDNA-binding Zn-finger/Zn-ribbon topoisomerase 1